MGIEHLKLAENVMNSNHTKIILNAVKKGTLKPLEVLMPTVLHDDWCGIYGHKKVCNCNPEVSVETQDGLIFLDKDGSIKKTI